MNSGSGQNYMDQLKAMNMPKAIRDELLEQSPEPQEEAIPTVQISVEEWNSLCEMVQRMQALSQDLTAQRAEMKTSAEKYAEVMKKAATAQTEASEKAIRKIAKEATEQVGSASEKASRVIDRRILRDELLWWLRLALTAIPTILVLLLWARVGLGM